MKKIGFIFAIVASIMMTACNNKSYTINGQVDASLDSTMVYLQDAATEAVIDSALVLDGKFVIKGEVQEAMICDIFAAVVQLPIIIEPGYSYEVNIDENNIVSNAPLNGDLMLVYGNINSINDSLKAFIEQIEPLMENGEVSEEVMEQFYAIQEKGVEGLTVLIEELLAKHPNDAMGVILMKYYFSITSDYAMVDAQLASMGDVVKTHPALASEIATLEQLRPTMSGAMFTDFTVTQPDGQDVSLSDYVGKGKYVLVDFWASWCAPCRRAMPKIKALYEEYNPKGLDVLGVLVWDEVEDSKKAIEEEKAPWPQILNTQRVATDLYAINGIPHLIFFAPDGTILKRGLPDDELINFVKETIDNNK